MSKPEEHGHEHRGHGHEHHEHGHHGPHELTVEVFAPSFVEPKRFTWPQNLKVAEAAEQAARAFGIQTEAPTFQTKNDVILDRQKSLIDDGVHECQELELVSAGGGV